jgi:hypothetical protein
MVGCGHKMIRAQNEGSARVGMLVYLPDDIDVSNSRGISAMLC